MFSCALCGINLPSLKLYANHFRLHRNVNGLRFKCCVANCIKTFATYSAFSTHISRFHENAKGCFDNGVEYSNVSLCCSLEFCGVGLKDSKALLTHLKKHLNDGAEVSCPFSGCDKPFKKLSSFSSHLSRKHPKLSSAYVSDRHKCIRDAETIAESQTAVLSDNILAFDSITDATFGDIGIEMDNEAGNQHLASQFENSLALFYLKLESKLLIPASSVQLIVDEITAIHELNRDSILSELKLKLTTLGAASDVISCIEQELNHDLLSTCNGGVMRNDYARKKYYKERLSYVEPIPYRLGIDQYGKEKFGQYIPIKLTLQTIFKNSSVRDQFLNPLSSCEGVFSDIVDGSVCRENALFKEDPYAIKIILYQDAFELVNPLGSSKKKHKLLAMYMTLANIYPHHRSTIDQMQLVLLCRETDLKQFGWEKVLGPVIQDLKDIESCGVNIFDNVKVKGSLACVVGDNLGSHGIGGFLESFSCSFFCRFCFITREEFKKSPFVTGELRTVESYKGDVHSSHYCGSSQGVKSDSVLNNLKYFHVASPGLPPCLGHDLFEGVVDNDMYLYINYMVCVLNWFSYDHVNRMISQFKYLGEDAGNKPCTINPSSEKLGGHAVQNWCLLRMLSLLVGDKIKDPDNEIWQLYLLLKKIVELVCSKSLTTAQVAYMRVLVDDYLDRRSLAFPDVSLRPKHHYLAHYAILTVKFGPLIHLWTMRFESKHSYFKRCIRRSQNFKNVCASLAERHQLFQAYLSAGPLYPANIQVDSGSQLKSKLYCSSVIAAIRECQLKDDVTVVCLQAVIKGCRYQKDEYIAYVTDVCENYDGCHFGKIESIMISDKKAAYYLVEIVSSYYLPDRHLYFLQQTHTSCYRCIPENKLCHVGPLTGYKHEDGVLISLKSALPVLLQ